MQPPITPVTPIILSSLDVERLERLLDAVPATPAAAALRAELDRAEVREPQDMPPDVVTMNATVRFAVEPGGESMQRTLVYPRDADGPAERLSVLAPVGSALLGLRVGQRMTWPAPSGPVTVRIDEVVYQPEREGALHR